jgi:hypothetical protein
MDVVTILLATAMVAIPSWFAARNHKGIQEVKSQVKNAHSTNLRDDVTRAINLVEALALDVRGLKQDLVMVEDLRRTQVAELRHDLERRIHEAGKRHL